MDEINYLNIGMRKAVLDQIDGNENKEAKQLSVNQYEIFKDRILPYVTTYLERFYSKKTVQEMPIVGSINLASRICKQEARIYLDKPQRVFTGVSEEQEQFLQRLYDEMGMNAMLLKANQLYKLQNDQIHLYIFPSQGKLKARVLMRHALDVVPKPSDPEVADAFVISGFDKFSYNRARQSMQGDDRTIDQTYDDGRNQMIGDPDDYKALTKRSAWWSADINFITDENGNIVSGSETVNELGLAPIVDIASGKDGEYWIRGGSAVTDFTIQYNAMTTDLLHIMRMQGFGQAYLVSSEDSMPESLTIGTNTVLRLGVNPNNPITPQFGFANANPDLAGSIQVQEAALSSFLTARGLDPKLVNQKGESNRFNSGIERLLAMIEFFQPSKMDYDTFAKAEKQIFKVIKAWLNTYANSDVLEYRIAPIPDDADVTVNCAEPQMVETETERLARIQALVELGVMGEVEKIMQARRVNQEEAERILQEIRAEVLPLPEVAE